MTQSTTGSAHSDPEQLLVEGQKLADGAVAADEETLRSLGSKLISLYDSPFYSRSLRKRTAQLVSDLAHEHNLVLDLVLENARHYARTQHVDDAFPDNPNSFDVLANLTDKAKVIAFLKDTIQRDWGIPRWEALAVLCRADNPKAEALIVDVIQGKYVTKYSSQHDDLRQIRDIRGQAYINSVQRREE